MFFVSLDQETDAAYMEIPRWTMNEIIAFATGTNYELEHVDVFSRNADVDMTSEDIWMAGGVRVVPSSASTLSIVSDNIADAAAGTGVRTMNLKCLDSNYDQVSEEITLTGTVPVVSTISCLRAISISALTSGSTGSLEGTLTVTHSGDTQLYILPGHTQSKVSHYTIPNDHTGRIQSFFFNSYSADRVSIYFQYSPDNGNTWIDIRELRVQDNHIRIDQGWYFDLPEHTDIKFKAVSDGNNADISAGYFIELIPS